MKGDLDWLFRRPIAHRGLHDRAAGLPENTISAARAAVEHGFGIECDVQLSADGEAMVFHDDGLERLTDGRGPLRERSAAELARLPVGGTGDRIPTLTELLDAIGGRVPLVVEVKSRHDGDLRLVRRVVEVLATRTLPVAVKSFDPDVVGELRRIAPAVARGIVAQSRYDEGALERLGAERARAMTDLLHYSETRPDFLSWRLADLPAAPPFLARLLDSKPVMTWTVRSETEADRVPALADQIVFEGFVPARTADAGHGQA